MAALNFPDNPSVDDEFIAGNGRRWVWNGTAWTLAFGALNIGATGAPGPTGPTGATGPEALAVQSSEPASTDVLWLDTDAVSSNSSLSSTIVDAKGDLIVGTADDTVARLAVGTNDYILVADSAEQTGLKWTPSPGIPSTIVDAKGDLISATADDTPARLAVGADGYVLSAESGETSGLKWIDPTSQNVVINGAMQVHQRGTSATGITTTGYYTADRWRQSNASMGTWTQTVENDSPTGSGFRKSLKMLCTAADASPAAADNLVLAQLFEGQNCQIFRKGTADATTFATSFWVKSNVTGTYICELVDNDNARTVSSTYTISSSGTWEKKTIIFPADTTGVFDNDNNQSLRLQFWLGAGTDFTSGTLNTTWGSSVNANRAVGQTNLATDTNTYWQVTGVQLQPGSTATPFQFEDYGTTLAKCQRYYYRLSDASVFGHHSTATPASSTTNCRHILVNPVQMRATASAIDTNGLNVYDSVNVIGPSAITLDGGLSSPGYTVVNSTVTGATQYRPYSLINANDTTDYIGVSAEL